jgi:outer membrane protein assembly factor BamB
MGYRLLHAAIVLLLLTPAARTDDRAGLAGLPGEVASTARRLAAADKLAAQKHWPDAIEEYHRILTEAGDDLVPLTPRHLLQARWLCHLRLAALPAEHLQAYRKRIDQQARKWFEQGAAARDERLLRRVVDEAFCSRHGDRALDLLGDLAFERGRFDEAERCWRRIVLPAAEADSPEKSDPKARTPKLVFPDPQVDVARIRAKQFLARLFQGSRGGLQDELKAFRARHAKAQGRLAGRQGNYADLLQALLDEAIAPQIAEETVAWPTFAADPGRGSTASGAARRLRRICFQPPQWRFSLASHTRIESDTPTRPLTHKPMTRSARNKAMAFHPVIFEDSLLVGDARSVVAYSLLDGQPRVWYTKGGLDNVLSLKLPAPADLRYTLTVAEDRVFARLGVQDFSPEREARESQSFLVCLNLHPGDNESRLRWQTPPDEPSRGAVFEGAPVVHDGRVYIAATRFEAGQTITAVHCYPAHADETPHALWKRDTCSTQELRGKEHRLRHHLLTLAGRLIVYASHSGAIVALDADTGKQVWAVRYPSQGGTTFLPIDDKEKDKDKETVGSARDLVPCLFAAGRIYAAPADYDRLICLDPVTGQTLWEREGKDIVHLLGVSHDKLVFTTTHTIGAADAATGADIWQMPDLGRFLYQQGRGFLADDLIFWPTSVGLKALQVDDGQQSRLFPPGVMDAKMPAERMGNLVFANGCLVVAGPEELDIYVAPARQRAEREADVKKYPDSASARIHLAIAQADAGFPNLAEENLSRAEQLANSEHSVLSEQALAARHDLLLDLASQAETRREWDKAGSVLEKAAAPEFSPSSRGQALARQAALWTRAKQPGRAVAAWQSILDDPALRASRVEDANDNPQNAATLATIEIDRLIRAHGSIVYTALEKRARQFLHESGSDRLDALRQLATQYPNAAVTSLTFLDLGVAEEKPTRLGGALRLHRAFLKRASNGNETPLVSQQLSKPETLNVTSSNPHFVLPLVRAWESTLQPGEVLLPPNGPDGQSIFSEYLFFAAPAENGGRLTCRETFSGKPRWTAALPFVPSWAGCHDDLVLTGGESGVVSLLLANGQPLWSFVGAAPLNSFRVVGNRFYFLEGGRRLFAIDAEMGAVLWSRLTPAARLGLPEPSGRFNPHYFAGDDRVVIQTSGGRRWLLEAMTGRILQDVEISRQSWPQAPHALDQGRRIAESFCLATDAHRIVRFDATTGEERWRFELGHRGSLTGELPQFLGSPRGIEFLLIPRNYGTTLLDFSSDVGRSRWKEERLLTPHSLSAEEVAWDSRALYFVVDNVLTAQGRADGKLLWTLPLAGPPGRWRVAPAQGALVVTPRDVRDARFQLRLAFDSVEWTAVDLSLRFPLAGTERPTFPLVLVDLQTGQIVQRLNFPLDGPRAAARDLPILERGMRIEEHARVVHVFGHGMIVAVPGKVCRLSPASKEGK